MLDQLPRRIRQAGRCRPTQVGWDTGHGGVEVCMGFAPILESGGLLAQGVYHFRASGIGGVAPGCEQTYAATALARRLTSSSDRPASMPMSSVAVKASPAPTVSA